MNKYDLHTHVSSGSSDSFLTAGDYTRLLKDNGYAGMVVTDHYDFYQLLEYHKADGLPVSEQNKKWLTGYWSCVEAFGFTELNVILGMEYSVVNESEKPQQHVLLYGLTEELVINGIKPGWPLGQLREFCKKNDVLMIQAHALRYGPGILPEHLLDGYEVMNTKPEKAYYESDYNSRLRSALREKLPRKVINELIFTGGGDCHSEDDVARGGIVTEIDIKNALALKAVLKAGDYSIIGLDGDTVVI